MWSDREVEEHMEKPVSLADVADFHSENQPLKPRENGNLNSSGSVPVTSISPTTGTASTPTSSTIPDQLHHILPHSHSHGLNHNHLNHNHNHAHYMDYSGNGGPGSLMDMDATLRMDQHHLDALEDCHLSIGPYAVVGPRTDPDNSLMMMLPSPPPLTSEELHQHHQQMLTHQQQHREDVKLPSAKHKDNYLRKYGLKLGLNDRGCYISCGLAVLAFILLVIIIVMALHWPGK